MPAGATPTRLSRVGRASLTGADGPDLGFHTSSVPPLLSAVVVCIEWRNKGGSIVVGGSAASRASAKESSKSLAEAATFLRVVVVETLVGVEGVYRFRKSALTARAVVYSAFGVFQCAHQIGGQVGHVNRESAVWCLRRRWYAVPF